MTWEWNWPHKVGGDWVWLAFDLDIIRGDRPHAPGFTVCLQVGRFALLDFGWYGPEQR